MLTVGDLIDMLMVLPPDTRILTAGIEGIHNAELGNLFPLRVAKTRFGTALYIDDGLGDHGAISRNWLPLNEFIESKQ